MTPFLSLETKLVSELVTTARLTTGGVAAACKLSYDDGEDCKVCVTESLLLLTHRGFENARVEYFNDEGLSVVVTGANCTGEENVEGDEISIALLNALAQNVTLERSEGKVYKISFRFSAQK